MAKWLLCVIHHQPTPSCRVGVHRQTVSPQGARSFWRWGGRGGRKSSMQSGLLRQPLGRRTVRNVVLLQPLRQQPETPSGVIISDGTQIPTLSPSDGTGRQGMVHRGTRTGDGCFSLFESKGRTTYLFAMLSASSYRLARPCKRTWLSSNEANRDVQVNVGVTSEAA
jgi:hypothetical protein